MKQKKNETIPVGLLIGMLLLCTVVAGGIGLLACFPEDRGTLSGQYAWAGGAGPEACLRSQLLSRE